MYRLIEATKGGVMKLQKRRNQNAKTHTHYFRLISVLFGVWLSLIVYGKRALSGETSVPKRTQASSNGAVTFTDARRQAAEFISYDRSIVLSPEQKKVMDEALSSIPAPCCAQYSIATCCCPCNLAKSTWGLSKFLIANQNANAAQVRTAASEWLQFSNPDGYTGDACFTKGCNRSFETNGCGGMDDRHIQ
jgi:hypothetical protein